MWLRLIACYVIVKTVSSERPNVLMRHRSFVLSLSAQERLLLSRDMWECWLCFSPSAFTGTRAKCVSLCECAAITTHSRQHAHLANMHALSRTEYVWSTHVWCLCLWCLSDVFKWSVIQTWRQTHTHTHTIIFVFLWLMLLFLSVWRLPQT